MAGTRPHKKIALGASIGLLFVLAWLGLLATGSPDRAGAAARACANADSPPASTTGREMRRAVKCLIDRKRAKRERRAVRSNRPLKSIAQKHTARMVRTNCFEHQCNGEAPLSDRIERSDYVGPGDRYGYGEVIGCAPSPRSMVEQWMDKPIARGTILERRFRHVGIGVVKGAPGVADGCETQQLYATYTVLFAWRRG